MDNKNLDFYFGYGSNLNSDDWNSWRERQGYPAGMLEPLFPAYLPDRQLRFTYRSTGREGGVLDVLESVGQVTPGVVFRVYGEGWKALDEKEGAPNTYRPFHTECLTLDGRSHNVTAYEVHPDNRVPYCAPNPAYLEIVRSGLDRYDLDEQPLDKAAENMPGVPLITGLFVYGTLLRGECRHETLQRSRPCCTLLAETPGHLLDCGDFPTLTLPGKEGAPRVQGEFVRLSRIAVLRQLDDVEGFRGFGQPGSLFRRALIEVGMRDGRVRLAWTYLAAAAIGYAAGTIGSADWREHRGVKEAFLKALVIAHCGGDQETIARRLVNRGPMPPSDEASQIRDLLPLDKALADGKISERLLAQASGLWNVVPGVPSTDLVPRN